MANMILLARSAARFAQSNERCERAAPSRPSREAKHRFVETLHVPRVDVLQNLASKGAKRREKRPVQQGMDPLDDASMGAAQEGCRRDVVAKGGEGGGHEPATERPGKRGCPKEEWVHDRWT